MDLDLLYTEHLKTVLADVEIALARSGEADAGFSGVVFHAGAELPVHRDDQPYLFRQDFHFARLAPVPGPDHLAVVEPGRRPRLIRVVPRDYWYEAPAEPLVRLDAHWDVVEVEDVEAAIEAAGDTESCAFVGEDLELAEALGIDEGAVEPQALVASLDWSRGYKTSYEVECIRRAGARAGRGHAAVRDAVAARASERELHHAYLAAAGLVENEVPYPNIIGWDENAAVLHYQSKDAHAPRGGRVLLIDAGASFAGYASDITRTWVTDAAPESFRALLDGMDDLQRALVDGVGPRVGYVDLHARAHEGVAALLCEAGVLRCGADEAIAKQLTLPFLPHGLGHHLGLQVHDVGGRQVDPSGRQLNPPKEHPFLRTTRPLEVGHVVTIEPGLYFIPMLLEPLREGPEAGLVDWTLVDSLIPCGGIRIEDDVLVTEDGREDLTRSSIPGHRGR